MIIEQIEQFDLKKTNEDIGYIKGINNLRLDWDVIDLQSAHSDQIITDAPENHKQFLSFPTIYINKYITKYNLKNTRVLKLKPGTNTLLEENISKRIIFSVINKKGSYICIDEKMYSLDEGKAYIIDSTLPNFLINTSSQSCVNIVGSMYPD